MLGGSRGGPRAGRLSWTDVVVVVHNPASIAGTGPCASAELHAARCSRLRAAAVACNATRSIYIVALPFTPHRKPVSGKPEENTSHISTSSRRQTIRIKLVDRRRLSRKRRICGQGLGKHLKVAGKWASYSTASNARGGASVCRSDCWLCVRPEVFTDHGLHCS